MSLSKPEIFYESEGGFGPLSIYWYSGPYGLAVEAIKGDGIAFFDQSGELLAVQFDNVVSEDDSQSLSFKGGWIVEVGVKAGKILDIKREKKVSKKSA